LRLGDVRKRKSGRHSFHPIGFNTGWLFGEKGNPAFKKTRVRA